MSRKLDAALAEALGWIVAKWVPGRFAAVKDLNESLTKNPLPCYSTDGNAMLGLDKEMRARGWLLMLEVFKNGKVKAFYWHGHDEDERYPGVPCSGAVAITDTMPEAVALAAYCALTGKEWTE